MIYLIGGKDKVSSRKFLADLKKNYDPAAVQTIVVDKAFSGSIKTSLNSQPLFGGRPLVILELSPDWKKHETTLVDSLPQATDSQMDALVWVDGALPKNSKLYKTITELGGKVTFYEQPESKEIWGLLDALAAKDRGESLAWLAKLSETGESAVGIVVMMTYLTRNLLSAKYQNNHFKSLTPWQQKKLLSSCQNFSEEELITIYSNLLMVDIALKTNNFSEDLLLTNLVISYTTPRYVIATA